MANPTLTANSPGAGSIAWTAFHIVYLGVDYSIPSGNTSHKYTWWLFNGGAGGALQTSDTLPTTLTDDDLMLFLNHGGTPINAQKTTVMFGDLIVPGTILAGALSATAVDGMTITGPIIRTATSGARMQIEDDPSGGVAKFYSGFSGETPGYLNPFTSTNSSPAVALAPGSTGTFIDVPVLSLWAGTSGNSTAQLLADNVDITPLNVLANGGFGAVLTIGGGLSFADPSTPFTRRGRIVTGMDFGDSNDLVHLPSTPPMTTGSNGDITIPHSLGVTPTSIIVTPVLRNQFPYVFSRSSTQFVVRFLDNTNTLLSAGTGVRVSWKAMI